MSRQLPSLALFAALSLALPGYSQQTASPTPVATPAPVAAVPPPAVPTELFTKLKALSGVTEIRPAQARGRAGAAPTATTASETYELLFEQPLDHKNPTGEKFHQRFFVSHAGFDRPVLLNTEGYAANGPGGGELRTILGGGTGTGEGANSITVEHRYFGRSVPDGGGKWEQLTVKNAADDMHAIVTALKTIYKGKWVATGTSKGGQTSLFYKCYYSDDMDATVAYVAPVNIGQEDPRINHFIETVGDEATRKKIKDMQIALFKREDEIIPLLNLNPAQYSLGVSQAYEYGILEYPYDFWQSGRNVNNIPAPDAPAQALADHYRSIGTLRYYSDAGKKPFEPFQYQAFTEIGYYNYDITDFKPYIKTLKNPTNLDICPPGTKDTIVFNPQTMAFVFNFLQYKANNVIYIYGETDAWSATQMQLIGRTNAQKIVVKDAHHNARIAAMSPEQKELFYSNMEQWLGTKLNRQ